MNASKTAQPATWDRETIIALIRDRSGNLTSVARHLNCSRTTLYRYVTQHPTVETALAEARWYAVRHGKPAHRTDDRTQTTLWEINLDKNVEGGHSTQKPIECMARPIRNHEPCEVYDPFLGSGTTMVAAEQLGRIAYGCEIEPKYVAVCLERLVGMGLSPRLVEDGRTR